MRKRFQEGGQAETFPREEAGPVGVSPLSGGALDPSMMMILGLQEALGRTTTPEAQARARGILDQFSDPGRFDAMRERMLSGQKAQAEQVRQALRTARERLMGQTHPRSEALLAIGRGLGAPTRTGAIGETAGNVAEQLQPIAERRRKWSEDRDSALSQLDLAEAQVDSNVLESQFALDKLQAEIEGRLAVEAMDTLGRGTGSLSSMLGKVVPEAAQALDREYIKEFIPFVSGGSSRAAAGLDRLRFAADYLENGTDALTGPYIGAVATLPFIGRWAQSYVAPTSADIRGLIEQTIQEDLRPTLGSQFTAQEGERLIARSFDMNLEEKRNARRVRQLIAQMEEAYENRKAMAEYFNQNQTLFGFPIRKIGYVEGDFKFDPDEPSTPSAPRTQYRDLPAGPEKELQLQVWREQNPGQEPPAWMLEGLAKGGRVRFKRGGKVRRRFQEGGIAFEPPASETTLQDDLSSLWEELDDPAGMAVGTAGGLILDSLLDTYLQRRVGGPERRVADAIESGGLDPVAVAQDIKRNRRAGVPEALMDTDTAGVRALAEDAFRYGDAPAEEALRELRTRLEESRERVNDRINTGLKPYDYFEHENKLISRLNTDRAREMKAVFDQYPGVQIDPVLSQVMDTPIGKEAIEWAMKFYENVPGRKPGQMTVDGMIKNPSLEFYDYMRKGFNEVIAQQENKGETEYSRVIRDLRQLFLDRLDQVAPEYKVAREAQGDDLEVRDALRMGRAFMKQQPQQLAEVAKNLSFHQKNAFRTGMAQHLYEILDKPHSSGYQAAQRIAGSPAMMERLRPFFDSDSQFKVFQTALEREAEIFRTGKELLKSGENARVQREMSRQSPVEYIAQRGPGLRFAISPMGWALRLIRDMPKMTPKEAEGILSVLRRGRPEEMNDFAQRVGRLRKLRASRNPRRVAAGTIGAVAGALLGNDSEE